MRSTLSYINRSIALSVIAFVLFTNTIFGQTEAHFVRSFSHTEDMLVLNLGSQVKVQTWDNSTVRVVMTVRIDAAHVNYDLLKGIAETGRYNLTTSTDGISQVVSAPNVSNKLRINGKRVFDQIEYTVFVPKNSRVIDGKMAEVYAVAKP